MTGMWPETVSSPVAANDRTRCNADVRAARLKDSSGSRVAVRERLSSAESGRSALPGFPYSSRWTRLCHVECGQSTGPSVAMRLFQSLRDIDHAATASFVTERDCAM